MAAQLPKISDLPLDKNGPHHNAWGLYGKDDQLGTLNRLTDSIVAAAAREIQTGTRINLDWPLDALADIPFFGRQGFHQLIRAKAPRAVHDDVWTFNTQSSSQWDGLRHYGYLREQRFYNGVTMDQISGPQKTNVLGIGAWAQQGIVGRGVLLDFHRWRTERGLAHDPFDTASHISAATLREIARDQGVEFRFGDILIIRSGFTDALSRLSRDDIMALRQRPTSKFAGVEQSDDMLEFLWNNFSAVGGDHPAFEAYPSPKELALHEVLLAGWGMPIGELFDLEKLGEHCKKVGRWTFFLVSKPTNVPAGVASPPNMVAIF